jgi:Secretion system C-terminal sorting domain
MRKNTIVLFSLFATLSVSAQEVVSTQGNSYSTASGSIDFTIGEVIINTGTNGTNDITQGFHQTNWNFVGLEDHSPSYEASIFPNPTEDVLNIRTSMFENVTYTLYDAQGKLVLQDKLSAEQTPIQVSQLAPGSYSLTLNNEAQNLKTFKLIKHSK